MNRTERLYAIAEELRLAADRGRTAASIARQFELSTRTIKRDVSALQQSGLPIYAQPGPGGGYRLLPSSRALPPVTFTVAEAAAIAVALGTQSHLPFATEGAAALTKVLGAMSPAGREELDALLDRVWTTTNPGRTRAARALDDAIRLGRVARIEYTDVGGASTTRSVDPIQYAHTQGQWYLLAYCHLRESGRWFRLDRIAHATLTKQPAEPHRVEAVIGTPPSDAHPVRHGVANAAAFE